MVVGTNNWVYAPHAKLLGKWLRVLFWLVIASNVASILTYDRLLELLPFLKWPGLILQSVCGIGYCAILLRLSTANRRYGIAGGCYIAVFVIGLLSLLGSVGMGISLVFALAEGVFKFIFMYNEYTAHSEVLYGLDNEMSYNWKTLWKWQIGIIIAALAAAVLAIFGAAFPIIAIVAIIIIIPLVIVSLLVAIWNISYLYSTAKAFRPYL